MDKYQYPKDEQKLLEGLRQPFAVFQQVDGTIYPLVISDGFCELFGYPKKSLAYEAMESSMYRNVHKDDVERIQDTAVRFAMDAGTYDVIYRVKLKTSNKYRMIHAVGKHVFTETGVRLTHMWFMDEGICEDGNESCDTPINIALSHMISENASGVGQYDYLTGLPTMSYYFELAAAATKAYEKEGIEPVLLYMDISGMKYYNYRYGFAEGNKLLIEFGKLLSRFFGTEKASYLGHGHFSAISEEKGIEGLLNDFFEEMGKLNGGNSLPVRIGIYPRSFENVSVSAACDRAKLACDALRGTYTSAYNYYRPEMSDAEEKHQYILENFDRAIKENWIQVYFQPIIRAVNGRVCDEEALARWIDPIRGILSPAEFIPVLEDAGLIYRLDLYILEQVLEKIAIQRETYNLTVVPHSINLSRSDFDACDIVEEIRKRVDEAGVSRDKITIEITESVIGNDVSFIKSQVERFQSLGFPVWMDDFGSGYSSMDVLQTIKFNLIKFDMSFMRKLDEGDSGKIILTELMKMAAALGVDTVCEGVEKESQVQFLQEIGCSKLQGFYYCKPVPLREIIRRYDSGEQIGFENPFEESYYQTMGRVNLNDLAVLGSSEDSELQGFFNTLPMCVIEVHKDTARFARSNSSYRDFVKRYFHVDLAIEGTRFQRFPEKFYENIVKPCCEQGMRSFYDEATPDGYIVHSFARRVSINPVNGNMAVAMAVLSIVKEEGTSYAAIAKALAADYYNIYYIDLETEKFIEYSSAVGEEEIAVERHGRNFFESAKRDSLTRIYEEDQKEFLESFTRENILRELGEQGVFTLTYRLVDTGEPIYVNMKITRMPDNKHIIMGISIVDSQMKQKELAESIQKERDAMVRVMAISDNYLSLYSIDPETGRYFEYSATNEYSKLGLAKQGEDFFEDVIVNGRNVILPKDFSMYQKLLTRENIMKEVRDSGVFRMQYHLIMDGEPKPVSLRIAMIQESDGNKLIAGVRAWKKRSPQKKSKPEKA